MNVTEITIILDNQNDLEQIKSCKDYLDRFGLRYEVTAKSALCDPMGLQELVKKVTVSGIKLFITAGELSSGLATAVASHTHLPVINIPLQTSQSQNGHALYALSQTPEGIPVATMGFGNAGARNAAILAAQILSMSDVHLRERLRFFKQNACRF
jgi:phosphoribosylaminoimidazole carboxylase PurE protein